MEKILLYIKHNAKPLWKFIERCNELVLTLKYRKQFAELEGQYRNETDTNNEFQFRLITADDVGILYGLLAKLEEDYVKLFKPHSFDRDELSYVLRSRNFLTFGYFYKQQLIGYFMLRLFANKKTFLANLVDPAFNGKGIGKDMVKIMYQIVNMLGWNAYATISEKNIAALKTINYIIIKKLPNDYLFIKHDTTKQDW